MAADKRHGGDGLEAISLSKEYPGTKALEDVSLRIPRGKIVALAGHNGAGKSTLTRILAGAESPDKGHLEFDGERLTLHSPDHAIRHGIVLVPQQLMVVPKLSVRSNLLLGMHAKERREAGSGWLARGSRSSVLREAAEQVGLHGDLNAEAERLRPAGQRLLMIGRALLRQPSVIMLDEPTANLAGPDVERLFATLRPMRDRGIGILYITHRLDEILEIADDVVVMRQGRVIDVRPVAEMTKAHLTELIAGHRVEHVATAHEQAGVEGDQLLRIEALEREPQVRGVSFTLHKGEILGMTGIVGSGRSSLLRTIGGIDPAEAGQILVNGKPVTIASPHTAIKAGIAFLPEDRHRNAIIAEMEVAGNVTLPSIARFQMHRLVPLLRLRRENAIVNESLDKLRIHPKAPARRKIKFLSGGNQQKAVLGRWLLRGADIYIFDEPTEGVDVGARQDIYRLIRELAQNGAGVIVSSSDAEEIVEVCERVLIMRDGQIVDEISGDRLTETEINHACVQADARTTATVP